MLGSFTLTPVRMLTGLAGLRPHPLATIFPPIAETDWPAFVTSVRQLGVVTPIVMHDGLVLDGLNRLRAAREAGHDSVPAVELKVGSPETFVVAQNEARRHLTTDQRAAIADAIANLQHGGDRKTIKASNEALIQSEAAKLLKVSRSSVQRARSVRTAAPELIEEVKAGRVRLQDAVRLKDAPAPVREQAIALARAGGGKAVNQLAKKAKRAVAEATVAAKAKALPDARFAVIYTDPPWSWEGGKAKAPDYATMTIADIKAMKIPAAADAVLFLWATAPTLAMAVDVIASWGFEYRSHCVWVKDRIGTGFWFRSMHELLLVATRGDMPAPALGDAPCSVVEAKTGRHSQKPDSFRTMIASMFPTAPKLELFCRGHAPRGWTAWGAEAIDDAA